MLAFPKPQSRAVSDECAKAMSYLERQGQRFCVEFGVLNAVEKARQHWRQRRKKGKPCTSGN